MTPTIREERPTDRTPIFSLTERAFPSDAEARLIDALRLSQALTLSLVAEVDGLVVGHLAFSPVTITTPDGRAITAIGLGPMAVEPARQRTGIGAALIARGLERLRHDGHRLCVVLGHPAYYPRHGFRPAHELGLRWEAGHDHAFFARELVPGAAVTGVVRYRPEFDGL